MIPVNFGWSSVVRNVTERRYERSGKTASRVRSGLRNLGMLTASGQLTPAGLLLVGGSHEAAALQVIKSHWSDPLGVLDRSVGLPVIVDRTDAENEAALLWPHVSYRQRMQYLGNMLTVYRASGMEIEVV